MGRAVSPAPDRESKKRPCCEFLVRRKDSGAQSHELVPVKARRVQHSSAQSKSISCHESPQVEAPLEGGGEALAIPEKIKPLVLPPELTALIASYAVEAGLPLSTVRDTWSALLTWAGNENAAARVVSRESAQTLSGLEAERINLGHSKQLEFVDYLPFFPQRRADEAIETSGSDFQLHVGRAMDLCHRKHGKLPSYSLLRMLEAMEKMSEDGVKFRELDGKTFFEQMFAHDSGLLVHFPDHQITWERWEKSLDFNFSDSRSSSQPQRRMAKPRCWILPRLLKRAQPAFLDCPEFLPSVIGALRAGQMSDLQGPQFLVEHPALLLMRLPRCDLIKLHPMTLLWIDISLMKLYGAPTPGILPQRSRHHCESLLLSAQTDPEQLGKLPRDAFNEWVLREIWRELIRNDLSEASRIPTDLIDNEILHVIEVGLSHARSDAERHTHLRNLSRHIPLERCTARQWMTLCRLRSGAYDLAALPINHFTPLHRYFLEQDPSLFPQVMRVFEAFDDEDNPQINLSDLALAREAQSQTIMQAVSFDGMLLKDVPKNRRTAEVCAAAVNQNEKAIEHVPPRAMTPELQAIAQLRQSEQLPVPAPLASRL